MWHKISLPQNATFGKMTGLLYHHINSIKMQIRTYPILEYFSLDIYPLEKKVIQYLHTKGTLLSENKKFQKKNFELGFFFEIILIFVPFVCQYF